MVGCLLVAVLAAALSPSVPLEGSPRRVESVTLGLPLAQGAFGSVLSATIDGSECIAKRAAKGKDNADTYLAVEAS